MSDVKDHAGTLVNCFFCENFLITREVGFPYGCRVMGFTSARMPSVDVYNASGKDCTLFVRKERGHGHHH
ncbi:MAG: uracil-DNA glycosylase [Deltaproteobacteria bacterium]|nr:uracil-DNA glycosylase [Deltaproteobacteria bacterium]